MLLSILRPGAPKAAWVGVHLAYSFGFLCLNSSLLSFKYPAEYKVSSKRPAGQVVFYEQCSRQQRITPSALGLVPKVEWVPRFCEQQASSSASTKVSKA